MGGMGPRLHFSVQLLHISPVALLVQLIAGVWRVLKGGLLAQAGRTGRPVRIRPSSLLSFQGWDLFPRKGSPQTCIQDLFSCFTLLGLEDSSDDASAQIFRCCLVVSLPTWRQNRWRCLLGRECSLSGHDGVCCPVGE